MNFDSFFKINYGLYVITSLCDQAKNGFIGNTVFQVTAEPAQLAISVNKYNFTHDIIATSKMFAISALTENVKPEIISIFGYKTGKDTNKFENIPFNLSPAGLPLLTENCAAFFECKVNSSFDVGTHTIFIGEVTLAEVGNAEEKPLTYIHYRNIFRGKAPKNAPTYVAPSTATKIKEDIYECEICSYQYLASKGDTIRGIIAGTSFESLTPDWKCPLCGAEKSHFLKI